MITDLGQGCHHARRRRREGVDIGFHEAAGLEYQYQAGNPVFGTVGEHEYQALNTNANTWREFRTRIQDANLSPDGWSDCMQISS
jgi:hypothetical protein